MSSWIKIALVFSVLAVPIGHAHALTQGTSRMRRIASFYRNRDGFIGTVAVARKNRIIFEKSYGYANVQRKIPFEQNTRFPIGSITKQFTAAAILLLQQDRRLKTTDLVAQYWRGAPAAWGHISLRNLLTQTSGIPDFDFSVAVRSGSRQPQDTIQSVIAQPLKFEPGTAFDYSNANYVLLGMVIESASGETYCQFLRERIFEPIGLTHTDCALRSDRIPSGAIGYRPDGKNFVPAEDDDLAGIAGAGNLYSTASDLIRWTYALHNGKVLNRASLNEMTTPFLNGYAYGLEVDGKKRISHTGAIDGFYAGVDYLPEMHATVVVLSSANTDGNQVSPGSFAMEVELMELMIDKHSILPSEGKELSVADEVLRRYVGRYKPTGSESTSAFNVTLNGNHLFLQMDGSGQRRAQMRAESQTDFYVVDDKAELEVDFDTDGSAVVVDLNEHSGTSFVRASASQP